MAHSGGFAELIGARHFIRNGANGMPIVERSGVYRNEDGHAFFLRKGGVVTGDVLAAYELDEDAELSDVQAEIVAAESATTGAASVGEDSEPETPAAPGPSTPQSHAGANEADEVKHREISTATFPAAVNEQMAAPVPVAPAGRRRRRTDSDEDRAERGVESPESRASREDRAEVAS